MTTPIITPPVLNRIKRKPTLDDLLDAFERDMKMDFNCHAIATIQSFDPGGEGKAPTVTATFNYKKTYYVSTNTTNDQGVPNFVPKIVEYAPIIDCPIYILQGGGFLLTFPIAVGDTCSILFNDRDLDNWMTSGQVVTPATNRLHSISDGIALIGVNSNAKPIINYDMLHALLSKGQTKLGISADKILAKNAAGKSLNDLMQELISAVNDLVTATAAITVGGVSPGGSVSSPPVNIAQIEAVATTLTGVASDMGALLE